MVKTVILAEIDFLVALSEVGDWDLETVHLLVLKLILIDSTMQFASQNVNHCLGKRRGGMV